MSATDLTMEKRAKSGRVATLEYAEDESLEEDTVIVNTVLSPKTIPAMKVSLRPLKFVAEKLSTNHPLSILLAGEPEELPLEEYLTKLPGWHRLLNIKEE